MNVLLNSDYVQSTLEETHPKRHSAECFLIKLFPTQPHVFVRDVPKRTKVTVRTYVSVT